jgi:hypothetical protein
MLGKFWIRHEVSILEYIYIYFLVIILQHQTSKSQQEVVCMHSIESGNLSFQARKIHFKFLYKVGCEFIKQNYMNVNVERWHVRPIDWYAYLKNVYLLITFGIALSNWEFPLGIFYHIGWFSTMFLFMLKRVKAHYNGRKMLSQIVFGNYVTFNFHQANIKRGFHKLYS